MKNLIAIIFAVVLALGITATSVCASQVPASDVSKTDTDATETVVTEIEEADAEKTEENPFAAAFSVIEEHADKILSALTLIGSLVLAFTYKRGLLPTLSKALGSIGGSVKSIGESTDKSLAENSVALTEIKGRINDVGTLFENISADVSALNDKLACYEDEKNNAIAMQEIMRAQVDMLYEIFMTSSLPQYAKDSVGERIAEMKTKLSCEDTENE